MRQVGEDSLISGEIKVAVVGNSIFTAVTPINEPVRGKTLNALFQIVNTAVECRVLFLF